jgi:hypothetical protein
MSDYRLRSGRSILTPMDPDREARQGSTGVEVPLSEYEQRVLEQMERQLTSDDPRLANTLTSRGRRSVSRYVLGGVGVVVGLLLLIFGVVASRAWLGVLGFIVMFAAVTYAVARPRTAGPAGVVRADGRVTRSAKPRPKKSRSAGLMTRLEERWQKRRDLGDH